MNILITLQLSKDEEDTLISNVPCILVKEGVYAVPSDCMADLRFLEIPYKVEPIS